MSKRWRAPNAKSGELKVAYGKEPGDAPDVHYCWRGDSTMSRDSKMLSGFFEAHTGYDGKTLREELERRGYDITTIKFSIQKKAETE